MKRIYGFFLFVLIAVHILATVPEAIKYQAVARDNSGNILANRSIGIRLSVLKGDITGPVTFSETHNVTTNALGLLNLEIGKGNAVVGELEDVAWGEDDYFIKIEMDENGGTNYTLVGTSQLVSVPYAFYAKEAGNGTQWSDTATNIYYTSGKVGVGTDDPKSSFEVFSSERRGSQVLITGESPTLRLTDTAYAGNGVIIGVAADSNDLVDNSGKGDLVFVNEAYGTGGGYILGTGVPSQACVKITDDCKVGIGTDAPSSKLEVKDGDIHISDIGSGVIMRSPDGNCWRMTVSNSGQAVFTSINCTTQVTPNGPANQWGAKASYYFSGNANDSSNNYDGTAVNVTLVADRKGNPNSAYHFSGYNAGNPSYVDLPNYSNFESNGEISISLWCKRDTNTQGQSPILFCMMPDNPSDRLVGTYFWTPAMNNSPIWDHGNIGTGGRLYSSTLLTQPTPGVTWCHLVFVRSRASDQMKIYYDGVEIASKSSSREVLNQAQPLRIGGGADDSGQPISYIIGIIDDIKIFDRALTPTEVQEIFDYEK
jgi:hypothetical protein